ncbi:hypothetical protein G9464_02075 [Halostella sp. JP-L12]|uniref:hypothetical protein n=1 Tax=Halostella TaxID=1843185 RepID=UPI0013CF1189|nr:MULTISPECIES: hypothetical protein [Halostella]NHN46389.1 hypothetical protein [Halostella sp. JP-L12]
MSVSNSSNFEETTADVPTPTISGSTPYRWIPYELDAVVHVDKRKSTNQRKECEECGGPLVSNDLELFCSDCGLIHEQRNFWHTSFEIEAERRQFDHNSVSGNGTLQNEHDTINEDSAAETTFNGDKLDFNVYSLDQYNDGRDAHRGRENGVQKLDRERRFLKSRAEACATTVGLSGIEVKQVVHLVTSINSGAFTSYGPNQEGGGQDAHIVAAIAYVGNKGITDIEDRIETRDDFQSLAEDLGMDRDDVRGALRQLHRQLSG